MDRKGVSSFLMIFQKRQVNLALERKKKSNQQLFFLRRERGYCRICWTVTASGDFETSGATTAGTGEIILSSKNKNITLNFNFKLNSFLFLGAALFPTAATFGCCNIGTKLSKITKGYDCAIIPCEQKRVINPVNANQ